MAVSREQFVLQVQNPDRIGSVKALDRENVQFGLGRFQTIGCADTGEEHGKAETCCIILCREQVMNVCLNDLPYAVQGNMILQRILVDNISGRKPPFVQDKRYMLKFVKIDSLPEDLLTIREGVRKVFPEHIVGDDEIELFVHEQRAGEPVAVIFGLRRDHHIQLVVEDHIPQRIGIGTFRYQIYLRVPLLELHQDFWDQDWKASDGRADPECSGLRIVII